MAGSKEHEVSAKGGFFLLLQLISARLKQKIL